MYSRKTGFLVVGLAGACLVALLAYRSGDPAAQPPVSPEAGDAMELTGPEAPRSVVREGGLVAPEPSTSQVVTQPIGMPRVDAGYYDHPSRPYGMAGFLLFSGILHVRAEDAQAAVGMIQQVTQVDEETARSFLGYIQQAKEDLDRYVLERAGELCAQREAMGTIPQLVAAFDGMDADVEARRAQLTRGSETILGEIGMRNFEMHIASKDRGKSADVGDAAASLAALGRSPEQLLESFCHRR